MEIKAILFSKAEVRLDDLPLIDPIEIESLAGDFRLIFMYPLVEEASANIVEGNKVAIQDLDGNWQLYEINTTEVRINDQGEFIYAECEHVCYELGFDDLLNLSLGAVTPTFAMTQILANTNWSVGTVELFNTESTTVFYLNPLAALHHVTDVWGGELRFRITVFGAGISGRYVDLLTRRGSYTGKRFEFGYDLEGIEIQTHRKPVRTAIYGWGRGANIDANGNTERLDFSTVEWVKGVGGAPADKPLGQKWVGDEDAKAAYGRFDPGTGLPRHIFDEYESQAETTSGLLWATWDYLQGVNEAVVSIRATAQALEQLPGFEHEKVRLGDTNIVKVKGIQPLESRIILTQRRRRDPRQTLFQFGNFVPTTSDRLADIRQSTNRSDGRSGIWDRASAFNPDGTLPTSVLDGVIDAVSNQISAGGGTVLLDADGFWVIDTNDKATALGAVRGVAHSGEAALVLGSRLLITDPWDWRVGMTSAGFKVFGEEIISGKILTNQVRIEGDTNFYWDASNLFAIDPANANKQIRLGKYDGTNYGLGFTTDGGLNWEIALDFTGLRIGSASNFEPGYDPTTKSNVFISEPTTPYTVGDLWVEGPTGDVYRCITAKASGAFDPLHWELASGYTDDTLAETKRRVFTAEPTTPYDVGDLWAHGPSGDIKRCITANPSGAYNPAHWELASEYTKGADWASNLSNIPGTLGTPAGVGLFLSATYLGFYDAPNWKTYMDNSGNFYLGGIGGKLKWNAGTTTLEIAGQITVEAGGNAETETGAQAKVDAVEIGGRNRAIGTDSEMWFAWSNATITFTDGTRAKNIKATRTTTSGIFGVQQSVANQKMRLIEGEEYTLSFKARGIVGLAMNYVYIMHVSTANQSMGNVGTLDSETEFKQFSVKFTKTLDSEFSYVMVSHSGAGLVGDWFEITEVKVEKGDKATDWTPAPEDVEAYTDAAAAAAEGADWDVNLSNIPGTLGTPAGAGLFLSSTHLGFYDHPNWMTYMDNTGKFYLGGVAGKLQWDGTVLSIEGSVTITGGSGIANLTDAGALATKDTPVFTSTPTTPYYVGDLWLTTLVDGTGDLKKCITQKLTGAYEAGHWVLASKYTEGADWSSNLTNIPGTLVTPSGTGLFLSATHLGFYSNPNWMTYMDNSGNFYLGGSSGKLKWNAGTSTLEIAGKITVEAGGNAETQAGAIEKNQALIIDSSQDMLFHFDEHLYSTQGLALLGTPVVTLRPGEGKFGGMLAVEISTTNHHSNPILATDVTGWTGAYRCAVTRTDEKPMPFADYSAKIVADATAASFYAQTQGDYTFLCSPSTVYSLSIYVWSNNLNIGTVRIECNDFDAANVHLETRTSAWSTKRGSWERLTVTFTTHASAAKFSFRLRGSADSVPNDTYWATAAQIEQRHWPTSLVVGSRGSSFCSIPSTVPEDEHTINFWIYQPLTYADMIAHHADFRGRIFQYGDYHTRNSYTFMRWDSTGYNLYVRDGAEVWVNVANIFTVDALANKWSMITFVKKANTVEVYLDGVYVNQRTFVTEFTTGKNSMFFGHSSAGAETNYWYDDFLTRPYAATATEIKLWHDLQRPFFDPSEVVDFLTEVTGAEKPANNATVGADWAVNLSNIPGTLGTPAGTGLFLSSTHLGFYDHPNWKTYMDNAGNFYLGGPSGKLQWDGTTLTIEGTVHAITGSYTFLRAGNPAGAHLEMGREVGPPEVPYLKMFDTDGLRVHQTQDSTQYYYKVATVDTLIGSIRASIVDAAARLTLVAHDPDGKVYLQWGAAVLGDLIVAGNLLRLGDAGSANPLMEVLGATFVFKKWDGVSAYEDVWSLNSTNRLFFHQTLEPSPDNTYDLGTTSLRWRHLYLSGNLLWPDSAGYVGTVVGWSLYIRTNNVDRLRFYASDTFESYAHFRPSPDATYDLGTETLRWRNLRLSGNIATSAAAMGSIYTENVFVRTLLYLRAPVVGSGTNMQIDFRNAYALYSDDAGAGTAANRLWFDTPDNGEIVFGPRAGGNWLHQIRCRAKGYLFEGTGTARFYDNLRYDTGLFHGATRGIPTADIQDLAVSTAKIAGTAVTQAKIATDAVGWGELKKADRSQSASLAGSTAAGVVNGGLLNCEISNSLPHFPSFYSSENGFCVYVGNINATAYYPVRFGIRNSSINTRTAEYRSRYHND